MGGVGAGRLSSDRQLRPRLSVRPGRFGGLRLRHAGATHRLASAASAASPDPTRGPAPAARSSYRPAFHAFRRSRPPPAPLRLVPHLRRSRRGRLGLGAGCVAHDRRRHRGAGQSGGLAHDRPGRGGWRHAPEGRAAQRPGDRRSPELDPDLERPRRGRSRTATCSTRSRPTRFDCAAGRPTTATSAWPTLSGEGRPPGEMEATRQVLSFVINSLSRAGQPGRAATIDGAGRSCGCGWPSWAGTRGCGTS